MIIIHGSFQTYYLTVSSITVVKNATNSPNTFPMILHNKMCLCTSCGLLLTFRVLAGVGNATQHPYQSCADAPLNTKNLNCLVNYMIGIFIHQLFNRFKNKSQWNNGEETNKNHKGKETKNRSKSMKGWTSCPAVLVHKNKHMFGVAGCSFSRPSLKKIWLAVPSSTDHWQLHIASRL